MFSITLKKLLFVLPAFILAAMFCVSAAQAAEPQVKAYLQITMVIPDDNRPAAVKVYTDYRGPFLKEIKGALTKDLLVRTEDVQVLHGFASIEDAQAYLQSKMFQNDVFVGLKGLWTSDPDVKIYSVF